MKATLKIMDKPLGNQLVSMALFFSNVAILWLCKIKIWKMGTIELGYAGVTYSREEFGTKHLNG
ncbi:hypothetical protein AB3N60_15865 [Leptospira sp. WS39.C2]